MSKTITTALAAVAVTVALAGAAVPAFADRVDERQARQAERIRDGLRDGSITRQEAQRLKAEQDRIAALERQAERDGRVTREERARLEAAQDRASKNIRAEKHDAESQRSRWSQYGGWGGRNAYNDNNHGERRWYRRWW